MADILKLKNSISQTFIGTGDDTICTLDYVPFRVNKVAVNSVETTSYTQNENVITINAAEGVNIVIEYEYWMSLPAIKGNDGMSAYEAALKGGWVGTEEDFYNAVASVTTKQATIVATGMLKGNGAGNVVQAIAGADYVVPSGNVATATALATGRTIQTNLASTAAATFDGKTDVNPGVTGVLGVQNGGTGNSSVDTAPTSGSTKMVTSGGVFNAISGKADASHTQSASTISAGTLAGSVVANAAAMANLNVPQVRNIYAGTADLVAGTSQLPSGSIYICYEA